MKKTITREEAIKAIVNYFNENEDEFNMLIESADSYDGYLGDNRYYPMEELNEIYHDTDADEILRRAFYGYDEDCYTTDSHGERHYEAFNPNRDYFGYNGYGNLISTDYPDYSDYNDDYFAEKIIDDYSDNSYFDDDIPEEVREIIDALKEEEEEETEEA